MRIFITGGAGYIGSVMSRYLINVGFSVTVLDRLFFGAETIKDLVGEKGFKLVKDDVRFFDPSIVKGHDVIVDLAALSNDPSGELNPALTYDINYLGRIRVARIGMLYGVSKYIFASTCSVYGNVSGTVDESSETNPLTTYAKSSLLAERDVLSLNSRSYSVTVLRFATAYGLSPRMRFDLVVNGMVLSLFKTGKIRVMRDGTQWRPVVHVEDISRAVAKVIESDSELVSGEIFNVGSNDQNYRIIDLANTIAKSIGLNPEIEWYGDPDKRSYRVNFDKINRKLGFNPLHRPHTEAPRIYKALESGEITDSIKTFTVKWYRKLIDEYNLLKTLVTEQRLL